MHTSSTTLHNPDIRYAYQFLLGKRVVKNQKDVEKKLGYENAKSYVSRILSGKTKASEDFRKRFEKVFLKPADKTWRDFVKAVEVDPVAEEYASEYEALYAKVVYLEKFDIQLLDVVIMVLANQIGEAAAGKIKEKIYDTLGVSVPKALPARGAKKKKAVS